MSGYTLGVNNIYELLSEDADQIISQAKAAKKTAELAKTTPAKTTQPATQKKGNSKGFQRRR